MPRLLIATILLLAVHTIQAAEQETTAKSSANKRPPDETTIRFPKIDRRPAASRQSLPVKLGAMPRHDPKAAQPSRLQQAADLISLALGGTPPERPDPFEIDLRRKDLSGLNLNNSLNDLLHVTFDSRTVWPPAQQMPKLYDRQHILDLGKNPGLGLRRLHARGVTGRGVGLAIIDQPLLVDHQEYKDRLKLYEEIHVKPDAMASMHGPAVASLAVGKTIGVAPEADLYYIGSWTGDFGSVGSFTWNFRYYAQGIRRLLQVNKQLPADRKIRVIAMQVGWNKNQAGYEEIVAACNEAKAAGLFLVSSSLEEVHGFRFQGLGRSPLADPDKFESYEPGLWWAKDFSADRRPAGQLLVPMDSRGVASYCGSDEYAFFRSGGLSWSIPYIAGVYALACQADPKTTPDRFWDLAVKTGRTIQLKRGGKETPFGPIIDPVALIDAVGRK